MVPTLRQLYILVSYITQFNIDHDPFFYHQESIKMTPRVGGRRDTGQVLRYLRTKAFSSALARPSVAHVVILLTAGVSLNSKLTSTESLLLKKSGAYLYVVGVGGRADKAEMEEMASWPSADFVFRSGDFAITDSLMKLIRIHQCDCE